jgi:hypothetical protein
MSGAGGIYVGGGGPRITQGTYTGDDAVNRAIPHRLGRVPAMVIIFNGARTREYCLAQAAALIFYAQADTATAVTAPNATNFYVGSAGVMGESANLGTVEYAWTAWASG